MYFCAKFVFIMLVNISNGQVVQYSKVVLKNVNLEIEKGDFVFLVGKTGSGKTSILSSLYGDLTMIADRAVVLGESLSQLRKNNLHLLRRKIGFVFQDFKLLMDRNVYANLSFVLGATGWKDSDEIYQRAESVLEYVGLKNKMHTMPYALSNGEQQLISVARALLNDPELIIADEPTANLDPDTSQKIMQCLYNTTTRKNPSSVIVATHQYFLFKLFKATKTFMCEDGDFYEAEL